VAASALASSSTNGAAVGWPGTLLLGLPVPSAALQPGARGARGLCSGN